MKEKTGDKKEKAFRFNFIDVIIILVVLAVLCAAGYLIYKAFLDGDKNGAVEEKSVTIEYVAQFTNIRDEFAYNVSDGDSVFESTKRAPVGTVIDVSVEPGTKEVYDSKSESVVDALYPSHSTVRVTIKADAVKRDDGYYVSGYRLSCGCETFLRMPHFTGQSYIVAINQQ